MTTKAEKERILREDRKKQAAKKQEEESFWKKQNDMDKFVTETRTRKVIQTIFEPLMNNQIDMQTKIEYDVEDKLNQLFDRMEAAEYVIYKTEKPDDRFTDIYERLTNVEKTRAQDVEANKHLRTSMEDKMAQNFFDIDCRIKGLD